jgi:hypothetical protein
MRLHREISNTDDIIDSRDVIERIRELFDVYNSGDADDRDEAKDELAALVALQEEAEPCCADWHFGTKIIRDSYFRDYAEQYADEIGAINTGSDWPLNCIDWEKAALNLQRLYTAVSFSGVRYWIC